MKISEKWLRCIRNWLFPILNSGLLILFITKFSEPKTGELNILSDQDSTEVFLDGKSKGITGSVDKNQNMFALKIESVYPGSYQLMLKKRSFNNAFIPDVLVNPGYRTSKSVMLTLSKAELINIDKKLILPELKNEIPPKALLDKEKQAKAVLKKIDKEPKLPETKIEESVTSETTIVSSIKKQITRRLTICLDGRIQLAKVQFIVNSSLMSTPSTHEFSIELPEGKNVITLTYSDAIGDQYRYSITKTIVSDDILILKQNDFEPNY